MEKSGKTNFLIDGFPRNKDNLDGWNQEMNDVANVKMVLFFNCSEEVSLVFFLCFSSLSLSFSVCMCAHTWEYKKKDNLLFTLIANKKKHEKKQ